MDIVFLFFGNKSHSVTVENVVHTVVMVKKYGCYVVIIYDGDAEEDPTVLQSERWGVLSNVDVIDITATVVRYTSKSFQVHLEKAKTIKNKINKLMKILVHITAIDGNTLYPWALINGAIIHFFPLCCLLSHSSTDQRFFFFLCMGLPRKVQHQRKGKVLDKL